MTLKLQSRLEFESMENLMKSTQLKKYSQIWSVLF